jgi:hypothetical protein
MEKNCAGNQSPKRATLLDKMEEEVEEEEAVKGTTFNMRKSAKFCGLQFGLLSSTDY